MAQQKFRVSNPLGMWIRKEPFVSPETEKLLLSNGQLVTKIGETSNPDWWQVSAVVGGVEVSGVSKKTLMVADGETGPAPVPGSMSNLMTKTLTALRHVAPDANAQYLQAIREGSSKFEQAGITTPQRMAHFLAQVMQETGALKVLREDMRYRVPQMLKIFGVNHHSARVTAAEAPGLARNGPALAERVYGLGNPSKAHELGNTQPGDGFRYRGNGILQMTGRDAHRRMGLATGLDFEGDPDLATLAEHALKPALKEWSDGHLNSAADDNEIVKITRKINGGENGLAERRTFFGQLLPRLRD
jgi:putative chitinase